MFYGKGAGGDPTASAVLGDLVAVARHRVVGGRGTGRVVVRRPARAADGTGDHELPHQPRRGRPPGVLAQVASAFAEHEVSIETVRQQLMPGDEDTDGRAALVVVTHAAPDAALSATVASLAKLDVVESVVSVMRVEGD